MEINQECKDLFEELEGLRKSFGWRLPKFSREVYVKMSESEDALAEERKVLFWQDDVKKQRQFCEKIKKTWHRQAWLAGKARPQTLQLLNGVKSAVHKLDEYRYSKHNDDLLTVEERKKIKQASDNLQKLLKSEDFEE